MLLLLGHTTFASWWFKLYFRAVSFIVDETLSDVTQAELVFTDEVM